MLVCGKKWKGTMRTSERVLLPVKRGTGMDAHVFGHVTVSSADLHRESLSSGKGLYMLMEGQTQCGYCLKA